MRLLPWLSASSKSLNLVFRTSGIRESLERAYAAHEHVGGGWVRGWVGGCKGDAAA